MLKLMSTIGLVAALGAALFASTAFAKGGDRALRVSGTCTAGSASKLKAKLDDGRIETEAEVDQNRVGHRWRVAIVQNGRTVFTGVRTTLAPSGSFEVRRLLGNRAGADRIAFSARSLSTGERCRASLSY
jgi:hypothetical protein